MDLFASNVFNVRYQNVSRGIFIFGNLYVPKVNLSQFPDYQRLGTGSAISHGNISRSYLNLSNLGPFYGSLTLETLDQNTLTFIVYNYLSALIPGYYPKISGPFSSLQNYYNLESVQSEVTSKKFFTKILGLGLGEINQFRVADNCRNGLSALSENFEIDLNFFGLPQVSQIKKQTNYLSILQEYTFPFTLTGVNPYMRDLDWNTLYNIKIINGGNTFPQFGWGGSRIGSVLPVTDDTRDASNVNYPSNLLENTRINETLGIIYSGQGLQCYSYPIIQQVDKLEFEDRNRRGFNQKIKVSKRPQIDVKLVGVLPYQQGRGIYDFFSTEVSFSRRTGAAENAEISTVFPPEGVQPGRNNAFFGVALTNFYSRGLNIDNQENSSRTPRDTRLLISNKSKNQSYTASNAPLVFNSSEKNNTFQGLPWTIQSSYVSRTTTSVSNFASQKVPILNEGITSMIVSGAYPLYRGSQCTEYSGQVQILRARRWQGPFSNYLSQYYLTEDFWDPNFNDTVPPPLKVVFESINSNLPISPNPPFRIKGVRIMLYSNQRVIPGSYVYSSVNMVGNATLSQFYAPSAKEISLLQGFNKNLLQDVYAKYQGNQGGVILMVSTDGRPPPMPPSCCQPIGIVLEEIEGIGEPVVDEEENQYQYQRQTNKSKCVQNVVDFENTFQLQNRTVLVKLFPMYANMSMSGFGNYLNDLNGYAQTVNNIYFQDNVSEVTIQDNFDEHVGHMYQKIRTLYTIHDNQNSLMSRTFPFIFYDNSIKGSQFLLDYPGPENQISTDRL